MSESRFGGNAYGPMPRPTGNPEVDRRNYEEWIKRGRERAAMAQRARALPIGVNVQPTLQPGGGGALVPPGGRGVGLPPRGGGPVGPVGGSGGPVGFPRGGGGVPDILRQEPAGRIPPVGTTYDVGAPIRALRPLGRAGGLLGVFTGADPLNVGEEEALRDEIQVRDQAAREGETAGSQGRPRSRSQGTTRRAASRSQSSSRSRTRRAASSREMSADDLNAVSLRSIRGEAEPSDRTKEARRNIDRRRRELEEEKPRLAKGGLMKPPKKAKKPDKPRSPKGPNPKLRVPRAPRTPRPPKPGKMNSGGMYKQAY